MTYSGSLFENYRWSVDKTLVKVCFLEKWLPIHSIFINSTWSRERACIMNYIDDEEIARISSF